MLLEQRGIPEKIIGAAQKVLDRYERKEVQPVQFNCRDAQSLEVGRRYRLFRDSRHEEWRLMTHERYNRYTSRMACGR